MNNQYRMTGLGPIESELIASLSAKGIRVFSVSQASKELHISPGAASDLVLRLERKKKLLRIEKGKYLIIPPEAWKAGEYTEEGVIIASQLIEPYYVSYWTAISFYGWTEQPSRTVFVAATKIKRPVELRGITIRFVKLRPSRFFGFERQWMGNQKIMVAEKEKAIVDCLDQPRYAGEIVEVAKGLWNGRADFDFPKMLAYALRMKNGAIIKRLGFLMDVLDIKQPRVRREALKHIAATVVPLDTGHGISGPVNDEWRVRVNVEPSNLTEWMRH